MSKLKSILQILKTKNRIVNSLGFVFLFLAFFLFSLLYSSKVNAQVPEPYVPCSKIENPEFQSKRPYQASPCNQSVSEVALYCGNTLILSDEINRHVGDFSDCSEKKNGKLECSASEHKTVPVSINFSNAEFPIMGNTELVMNSQQPKSYKDELTDADKVNEYVSWYLSGVPYAPEYEGLDMGEQKDIDLLVNYSGPIKKLMPLVGIQRAQTNTVFQAKGTRHNQIVVCGSGKPCYGGDNKKASQEIRLSDWEKNLSILRTIPNTLKNFVAKIGVISDECIPWNKRTPPLPGNFKNPVCYEKAYNEWRGRSCVVVKIPFTDISKLFCVDNPLIKNRWADLFPYVPLSSTEDRKGAISVEAAGVSSNDQNVKISNVKVDVTDADLFFAHTEEDAKLADLLQSTYVSKDTSKTGPTQYVSQVPDDCYLVNIRSNPGDELFPGRIEGKVEYDVKYTCTFSSIFDTKTCTKDIGIGLKTKTKTPKADELWERLVAGPAGIFKRIFPKVGIDGAVVGILDIPTATSVTVTGAGVKPPEGREGQGPELYFPHIGGIYEYFLKGIQTALRPKGYGEEILSGDASFFFTETGEIKCNQNAKAVTPPNAISKEELASAAERIVQQEGNHAIECYNDVVSQSKSKGVDPIFALTIWLRESNASNYNVSLQDFGYNSAEAAGFQAQIEGFFRTIKSGGYKACACDKSKGWKNPMHGFLTVYRTGDCIQSAQGDTYYDTTKWFWSVVAPSKPFPTDLSIIGASCN